MLFILFLNKSEIQVLFDYVVTHVKYKNQYTPVHHHNID
jgi:hypothetical protein